MLSIYTFHESSFINENTFSDFDKVSKCVRIQMVRLGLGYLSKIEFKTHIDAKTADITEMEMVTLIY